MEKLNDTEQRVLNAIIDTCDDLDGELFTRLQDVVNVAIESLGGFKAENVGQRAGGYIKQLEDKGYLDYEENDGYGIGVWVNVRR